MTESLTQLADAGDFDRLFRLDLFWQSPDQAPIHMELDDGLTVTAKNVSSYKGVRVWEVPTIPGSAIEAKLDQIIAQNSTNRLVIFHDGEKQVWRWPSRSTKGAGVTSRPARHVHKIGSPDPQFEAKLDAIRLPSELSIDVNELLSRVRGAFDVETKNETKRASKLMVQMYAAMEKGYGTDTDPKERDHEISVTLARILFLLFGDDTEMWKDASGEPLPDLFQDFIKNHTTRDGTDIAARLNSLFKALDQSPAERGEPEPDLAAFPYINGGIFHDEIRLHDLDGDFRDAILAACAVDWSTISPAIFGSMFQSVRDAQTRRELGEHYTSEENILKTLNPLFLDELRAELDAGLTRDTAKKRINALNALWKRLGDIRYLDPACGCGNFIIVAYREMRDIELRIMEGLANSQQGEGAVTLDADWTSLLKVTLDHFSGIEIDEWPARIAETAMFLVDRQSDLKMKERFGDAPERLPISVQARIVVGSALRTTWEDLVGHGQEVIIAGNPPFRGGLKLSPEQQADRTAVYDSIPAGHGLRTGRIDFVCAWFAKAGATLAKNPSARAAFVATNSITQGEQARVMGPLMVSQGMSIDFAHQPFEWSSEAPGQAAVHVVIVGFSTEGRRKGDALLFVPQRGRTAELIKSPNLNWWLAPAPHVEITPRREPLVAGLPRMTVGSQPTDGGNLLADSSSVGDILGDSIAAKYLRRYMGAEEMMSGAERWCLWLVDSTSDERKRSPVLRARIAAVADERSDSPTKAFRETPPHLFTHRKHPGIPYLALPQNSTDARRWIPVAEFDDGTVASNKATIVYPASDWMLAFLQSQMYQTWVRVVGGRLKSDPTITADLSFNSFPWPEFDDDAKSRLAAHGHEVLGIRAEYPTMSLGALYDARSMPADLEAAHEALDVLVDGLYGLAGPSFTDRERALFDRYIELTRKARP